MPREIESSPAALTASRLEEDSREPLLPRWTRVLRSRGKWRCQTRDLKLHFLELRARIDVMEWRCWLTVCASVGLLSTLSCAQNPGLSEAAKTETQSKLADHSTGASPIRFTYRPIAFEVDSCETPERHAP